MAREFVVETDGNLLRLVRSRRPALMRLAAVSAAGVVAGFVLPPSALVFVPVCGVPLLALAGYDALKKVRRTLSRKGAFVKIGQLELPRDEVEPWLGARANNGWPLGARVTLDGRAFCVPLVDVRDSDEANALADTLSRFLGRPVARG